MIMTSVPRSTVIAVIAGSIVLLPLCLPVQVGQSDQIPMRRTLCKVAFPAAVGCDFPCIELLTVILIK